MANNPEVTMERVSGHSRIVALDSLRGIAALIVVFHHIDNALDLDGSNRRIGHLLHDTPLRLLIDGRAAVMLFFVLSGFALSISIGRRFDYAAYLVKRVCRLMVPCVAAVLFAAGAMWLVHPAPVPELGKWFNEALWERPVSWQLVLRHVGMSGAESDVSLINVLWSLVIELRISIIFPAVYFLVRGRSRIAAVLAVAAFFLFRALEIRAGNFPPFFNRSAIDALNNIGYYLPFFVAGIIARENGEWIKRLARRLHWSLVLVLLLAALRLEESGVDFEIGVGAFLIITLCVSVPFISNALSVAPIEWLGKVSYSLYLIHLTLLATVLHLFYGKVGSVWLCLLVVAGSLGLADGFYRLVEAPSILLGRKLTSKKKQAIAVAA